MAIRGHVFLVQVMRILFVRTLYTTRVLHCAKETKRNEFYNLTKARLEGMAQVCPVAAKHYSKFHSSQFNSIQIILFKFSLFYFKVKQAKNCFSDRFILRIDPESNAQLFYFRFLL